MRVKCESQDDRKAFPAESSLCKGPQVFLQVTVLFSN